MTKSKKLPAQFPEGSKYVLEAHGGRVHRYVEFPDGRKITLPSRKAAVCAGLQEISIIPSIAAAPRARPARKIKTARASTRKLERV